MLHPEVIQDLQIDVALDFAHDFWRKGCFAGIVQFAGFGQQYSAELVGVAVKQAVERRLVEWEDFA